MSFKLDLEGSFCNNFKRANEGILSSPPKENPENFRKTSPLPSKQSVEVKVINCPRFILVLKVNPVLKRCWPEIINSMKPR